MVMVVTGAVTMNTAQMGLVVGVVVAAQGARTQVRVGHTITVTQVRVGHII